jgi:hypothetical protein
MAYGKKEIKRNVNERQKIDMRLAIMSSCKKTGHGGP